MAGAISPFMNCCKMAVHHQPVVFKARQSAAVRASQSLMNKAYMSTAASTSYTSSLPSQSSLSSTSSPPSSTSTFESSSDSAPAAVFHQPEPKRVANHLNHLLEGLQPPISEELAMRMVTHKGAISPNAPASQSRHNSRLSFLGRRVLRLYLSIFFHAHANLITDASLKRSTTSESPLPSSSTAGPSPLNERAIEEILTTYSLGQFVAPRWELEGNMRWRQMIGRDGRPTGFQKISGETVEAIMGCIYHQYGAAVALKIFNSRILPFLPLPNELRNPAIQLAKTYKDLSDTPAA